MLAAQLRPVQSEFIVLVYCIVYIKSDGRYKAIHVRSLIVCVSEPEMSPRPPTHPFVVICPSDAPERLASHRILAKTFINDHII